MNAVPEAISVVENPFRGLRPFEPHESFLCFGRNEQLDELIAHLEQTPFSARGRDLEPARGLFPLL